jgi:outer membrane protein assembly factor BamC
VVPEKLIIAGSNFDVIPRPRPIETRFQEGVRVQSFGDESWIVIDATPSQVWPLIRDYWTELEVLLDYENAIDGVMETAWVEIENDISTRNKYKLTIEPGLHPGYSEIYVLHLSVPRDGAAPATFEWPETSHSEERESRVKASISQYLADRNDVYQASSSSLLAGSIAAVSKANLIEGDEGVRVLELRVGYDRAWAMVRTALEAAEINILDSDRVESVFNVQFAAQNDEEDSPGFIRRVFSFGSEDEEDVIEFDFRLRLQETGNAINVIAETQESDAEIDSIKNALLLEINNNLS